MNATNKPLKARGLKGFWLLLTMVVFITVAVTIAITVMLIVVIVFFAVLTVRRSIRYRAVAMLMPVIAAGFTAKIMRVFTVRGFHSRTGRIFNIMPVAVVALRRGRCPDFMRCTWESRYFKVGPVVPTTVCWCFNVTSVMVINMCTWLLLSRSGVGLGCFFGLASLMVITSSSILFKGSKGCDALKSESTAFNRQCFCMYMFCRY